MSKASVAQEPSMDEILASIRRIIETGEDRGGNTGSGISSRGSLRPARVGSSYSRLEDHDRDPAAELGFAPINGRADAEIYPLSHASAMPEGAEGSLEPDDGDTHAERDAETAAKLFDAPISVPDADTIIPVGSLTDEDRLTAELESELAATWHHPDIVKPEPTPPNGQAEPAAFEVETDRQAEGRSMASAAQEPVDLWREKAGDPRRSPETSTSREPAVKTSDNETPAQGAPPIEERGSLQPANTDRRPMPAATGQAQTSETAFGETRLASEVTGSLVAASFEELSQAIRSGELRSLEAMAQDMLRPLLQDWLDDNLPRMVERLVREEIERMSRGGRR